MIYEGMVVSPIFRGRDFEPDRDLVFVLLPFNDRCLAVLSDHIKPIVERSGLICRKADDLFAPATIIEDIWEELCRAIFVIADLTGRNPNVFYELGIAHTLGKEVVLITGDEERAPFDVQHIRHIRYQYTPPGMKAFEKRLESTIQELIAEAQSIDRGLLEAQTKLKHYFSIWKRAEGQYPPLLPSWQEASMLKAYAEQMDDQLDAQRLAFMLLTAIWYQQDLIYWADKNNDNQEVVSLLVDILGEEYRRPAYRVGFVLERLSPTLRRQAIDTVRRKLPDDERALIIVEKAALEQTLEFWVRLLPGFPEDPKVASELAREARALKKALRSEQLNDLDGVAGQS